MGVRAGVQMDSYAIFKTIHIVGVIFFVGNIAVTGWWKTMADRTRDPKVIAFAQRQVTLTDYVFTAGGLVLLIVGGAGSYAVGNLSPETPWIHVGTGLFAVSGFIWFLVLIPVQAKLARFARDFAAGGEIPDLYWRLEKRWSIWGAVATLLPLAAVAVMVGKVG